VPLIRRALKVFIVAVGAIFVLQNLNVDVAGLVAGLGLGGLAFALAAKETVANLFGSATIFADRPFHIGDWVRIGDAEGIVESVGFRSTKIRTFYNSVVSIPNSTVANAIVDNLGARVYRRCRTVLGVRYDTTAEQVQAFVDGIRAIITNNPHTRKDYYEIHFNDFGASSLNILVYFFLKVPSWSEELRQRHNVLLEILRLAKALGVEFAFPTQTLHIESLAATTAVPNRPVPSDEQLATAVKAFSPGGSAARPQGPQLTDGYFAS
jgi:MscS family membrane protein